jgi:N-acetylneuraminic acid mutarotase
MPDVRAFMSAGYYNGKIYLVGGYSTGSVNPAYAQTWEYDVLANTWTAKADMPHALGGAASAVVNGHLYVFGGRDAGNVVTDQTYDYDIVHNTWSSRLNLPYPVNVASAAVLDGKIWVIGGGTPFLAGGGPASLAVNNMPEAFNTTQIYDPAANSWSPGPPLNVQRSFLGAAGVGSFAVAIGGYNGSTTSDATEVTMNCPAVHFSAADYSVSENAGTIQIPVTLEPASLLTATINFFTANGSAAAGSDYTAITGTLTFPPGVTSKTFNVTILNDTVFEDNETVLLWLSPGTYATILPPDPAKLHILNDDPVPALTCGFNTPGPWVLRNFLTPSAYGPAVTNDGTFAYVIGGYSMDVFTDTSQTVRYNPIANTWTALAPTPKVVTLGSAVYAPINHKLYLFGGESVSSNLVYSSTLIYDITHNSWSNGAPMPGERAFMSGGYSNGKIYLVGGYTTTAITSAQAQTWEYNVLANTWTVKANMPHALGGSGAAVVNGHLYVIGGRDSGDVITNQVYNYNIATNTWSSGMNAPYAVNVPGVAVLHDKIWVIGGGSPFLGLDGSLSTLDLNAPSTYNTTRIYDPVANNWSNGPNLNVPRSFIGATGFGNFAVAFGGYSGSATTGAIEITWACPNGYLPVVVNQGP